MAARRPAQVNIRSDIVKRRIREVTERTGMTATQFIEQAVLNYDPPSEAIAPGLKRLGWLLVATTHDGRAITLEEANAEIDAIRSGDRD